MSSLLFKIIVKGRSGNIVLLPHFTHKLFIECKFISNYWLC
ncbi:hypothetical protein PROVRETT_07009 [Providencia rettgeri DSM 1131]|nr:hypothetical protein PROVRETT_07009 [Providencia rettgeri DSM 1131]